MWGELIFSFPLWHILTNIPAISILSEMLLKVGNNFTPQPQLPFIIT